MAIGGMAAVARSFGHFTIFVATEAVVVTISALLMDRKTRNLGWTPLEGTGNGVG
jgi:hypothetical protein